MFNFTIKAAVREYFSYRYDEASFQVEQAKLTGSRTPTPGDFRTRRQREEDESENLGQEVPETLAQNAPASQNG